MAVIQLVDELLARLHVETSSGDVARQLGWACPSHSSSDGRRGRPAAASGKKRKKKCQITKGFSFVFILFLIWLRVSPGYVGSGWGRLHPASIPPVSLLLNSGQRLEGKCVRMPLTITESL